MLLQDQEEQKRLVSYHTYSTQDGQSRAHADDCGDNVELPCLEYRDKVNEVVEAAFPDLS